MGRYPRVAVLSCCERTVLVPESTPKFLLPRAYAHTLSTPPHVDTSLNPNYLFALENPNQPEALLSITPFSPYSHSNSTFTLSRYVRACVRACVNMTPTTHSLADRALQRPMGLDVRRRLEEDINTVFRMLNRSDWYVSTFSLPVFLISL